jgi:hypothetical protein
MKRVLSNISIRSTGLAVALLGSLAWCGCSSMGSAALDPQKVAAFSPVAEMATSRDAAHLAGDYIAAHPGTQVALGTGDSMMPRYRNNTVIVVERRPMSELKPGMTIVFQSREGWPVAHVLVARAADGWITQGLNNPQPDGRPVTEANYVGVLVKAYELSNDPMLALSRDLSSADAGAYASEDAPPAYATVAKAP